MHSTYIIAEVGQAHDGSIGILMSLIESAANCGVDAVKFQIHLAEYESSVYEPFRINFSYEDPSRFDYWKRMEFSFDQWMSIKEKCLCCGVDFIATPFSLTAVDLLERLEVTSYKIGSGNFTNTLLLDYVLKTEKPISLSCGMAIPDEIDKIVAHLRYHQVEFTLLQCTTNYPTAPEDIHLKRIPYFLNRYNCSVGLSDHTGNIYSCLGAVALGANVIEAHITFDKSMFGPDASSSLTPSQFKELVNGVRFLEKSLGKIHTPSLNEDQSDSKKIFGSSLTSRKSLKKGDLVDFSVLEMTKPAGKGILSSDYLHYLNKHINTDLPKHTFLQPHHFE